MAVEDLLHPLLGAYMRSPQWVKSTVGRAYASVPKRIKYGFAFERFRRDVERCYRPQGLAQEVERRLGATLRHALLHVPAFEPYRHLLERQMPPHQLLLQLPLTSKLDLKHRLEDYASTAHPPSMRLEMFTGGSTANPMRFFSHKHVTRPKESAYFEDFDRRAGLTPDDVILNLRGRTVPGAGTPGGRIWLYEPIRRHLILSSDHLEPPYMPQYVEALREWKPTFVQAYASALYPLARWLEQHPEPEVAQRIRGIQLTSENVYPHQLDLFRKVFGCPVLRGYGQTERAALAASMPDDDRYFFWPLYGWVELVDEQGRPVAEPGVLGEIVVTSFDNEVMPFVRYRMGDFGAWSDRPHPRLPGWQVLERIEGRLQEFLVCHDHRLVTPNSLSAAHYAELSVAESIQYEQHEPGRVALKVVAHRPLTHAERKAISAALRRKAQDGIHFEVVQVPAIERTARGKHKMVVQHLDISGYLSAPTLPSDAQRARLAT
ncbi:MAG: AMP-binding protein [Pseudomonadota bacterium]